MGHTTSVITPDTNQHSIKYTIRIHTAPTRTIVCHT